VVRYSLDTARHGEGVTHLLERRAFPRGDQCQHVRCAYGAHEVGVPVQFDVLLSADVDVVRCAPTFEEESVVEAHLGLLKRSHSGERACFDVRLKSWVANRLTVKLFHVEARNVRHGHALIDQNRRYPRGAGHPRALIPWPNHPLLRVRRRSRPT